MNDLFAPRDEHIERLKAECKRLRERLAEAKAENARIQEALEVYADKSNWLPSDGDWTLCSLFMRNIGDYGGEWARRALEGSKAEASVSGKTSYKWRFIQALDGNLDEIEVVLPCGHVRIMAFKRGGLLPARIPCSICNKGAEGGER